MRRNGTGGRHLPRRLAGPALAVWALWGLGCPGPDNPYRPYPEPDYDDFVAIVQPIVRESCASLGCHGDPNRRVKLYAVGYLRAEPAVPGAPLDEDRLSTAELGWNYDSLRARLIDEEDADESRLLLKCLDPAQGGIEHADGEVVWETREDPDYVAFRDWIETGL